MKKFFVAILTILLTVKCEKKAGQPLWMNLPEKKSLAQSDTVVKTKIELKKEVPILCYHNLTETTNTIITVSHERFEEHIRSLVDSGYHSILPDQLYDYLTAKASLPSRPIVISLDDTWLAQYTIAAPVLEKYGFKGVFFNLTVCVSKPNYMSSIMVNDLASRGHIIAAHTYDHPSVTEIGDSQWRIQLKEPKIFLENTIHNPVDYFAYPYGSWTAKYIEQLKKDGYKAAFQLDGKQSLNAPLYTIRRLMVEGRWSAKTLHEKTRKTFNNQ